jgi:hypothetical protein
MKKLISNCAILCMELQWKNKECSKIFQSHAKRNEKIVRKDGEKISLASFAFYDIQFGLNI